MKVIPICLAAAAALFWAAGARAANEPDDTISSFRPYMKVPISAHLASTNSFDKLSAHLPEKPFEASAFLPANFVPIAQELKYGDSHQIVGFRPNSFLTIRAFRPEPYDTDVARFGLNRDVQLAGHLPHSFLKISDQYPGTVEH